MENPILKRLAERQNVHKPDPAWLLTLLATQEVSRYSLDDWNGALSHVLGFRVFCPSYKSLSRYLQEAVLRAE